MSALRFLFFFSACGRFCPWKPGVDYDKRSKSDGELFEVVGDRIGLRIRAVTSIFPFPVLAQQTKPTQQWMRVPRCWFVREPWHTYDQGGKRVIIRHVSGAWSAGRILVPGTDSEKTGGGNGSRRAFFPDRTVRNLLANFSQAKCLEGTIFADGRMTCGPCLKDVIFKWTCSRKSTIEFGNLCKWVLPNPMERSFLNSSTKDLVVKLQINASGNRGA